MKKYFLFLFPILIPFFSSVYAQSLPSTDSSFCPVFSTELANFNAQKIELEYDKQQLKLAIIAAYTKIQSAINTQEKASFKDEISLWKKELMLLNYKLFLLYKNQYFSKIVD